MVLERIVADKRKAVATRMKNNPLDFFKGMLPMSDRSLEEALRAPGSRFILECKRKSPSAGEFRSDFGPEFDPAGIAKSYADVADAISVLCDEPYFGGDLRHLNLVRDAVPHPVLCKDFVVDPYQVYEARAFGANAILLMCSVLTPDQLKECFNATKALEMDALVEVHDREELKLALDLGASLIGINNRNLKSFDKNIGPAIELVAGLEPGQIPVAASGIATKEDIIQTKQANIRHFLIGESIVRSDDPAGFIKSLKAEETIL